MGGNVFDMTTSIERERIVPTLAEFYKELKKVFPKASSFIDQISTTGSVGKKPVSGDLDLVMDGELISPDNLPKWDIKEQDVENLVKDYQKRARTSTVPQLYRRAVLSLIGEKVSNNIPIDLRKTGSGMLFFAFPQFETSGEQTGDYIQIDLNVGKKDWLEFSYYSDEYTGNIKGLHRTQLLAALFSVKGYTFNHGFGVKDKETNELVADNPTQALEVLNKEYNTNFTIESVKNFYTLFKEVEEKISEEDIKKIVRSYIKRLDQAKAEVPQEVEKYLDTPLNEQTTNSIGLFPGGFKPPHKGHFHIAQELAKQVDVVMVLIGPKVRDGIDASDSRQIWEIYRKYINKPVALVESKISPISDVYTFAKENKDTYQKILVTTSETETDRYNSFQKNKVKYGNVEVFPVDVVSTLDGKKVSGSDIRTSELNSTEWIPQLLSKEDKQKVLQILSPKVAEVRAYLTGKASIDSTISEFFKNKSKQNLQEQPTPIGQAIPSRKREQLANLYKALSSGTYITTPISQEYLFLQPFRFDFQQNRIVITIEDVRSEQDLNLYMDSIKEYMIEQGYSVSPLPTINLSNSAQEGADVFKKTGYYDPETFTITIFTEGRHPKDILRTFTHEMIHHIQNIENRLPEIATTNTNEDENLNQIEQEAYLEGSMVFRMWEDQMKNKTK